METTSTKKILPAFLLSTFLGVFGAHRFYCGRTWSAVAMLLLTLSFIGLFVSAIWNLIDWIMLLVGSFKDGEGKKITSWT